MKGARLAPVLLLALCACDLSMARQARPAPQGQAELWPGGPPDRPPPAGATPFGPMDQADQPPPMSAALLERGRQRFAVFCLPCHGVRGHGDGAVVQRGFPAPPSYDLPRLVASPVRHFYDVASNGYGVMYGYADRMPADDRWAVAAYVRVLQMADASPAQPAAAP